MSRDYGRNTGDISCVICTARPGELHLPAMHDAYVGRAGEDGPHVYGPGLGTPAPDVAKPARMTLGEVTRRLLDLQARPSRERSSVTVTRNARHVYQFEVTVYAGDTGAETPEQAHELAVAIADALETKYPRPERASAGGEGES